MDVYISSFLLQAGLRESIHYVDSVVCTAAVCTAALNCYEWYEAEILVVESKLRKPVETLALKLLSSRSRNRTMLSYKMLALLGTAIQFEDFSHIKAAATATWKKLRLVLSFCCILMCNNRNFSTFCNLPVMLPWKLFLYLSINSCLGLISALLDFNAFVLILSPVMNLWIFFPP